MLCGCIFKLVAHYMKKTRYESKAIEREKEKNGKFFFYFYMHIFDVAETKQKTKLL
jgi:hypothetical protein